MGVDVSTSTGDLLAEEIVRLKREELQRFMRQHLRRRDLHTVVANLNETALSKDSPSSEAARKALKLMGFAE